MKDYTYSFDIPKKYRDTNVEYYLFYEKDNGKLYVYLSNGSVKEFTYSKEAEDLIINRMEAQVEKYADDFIKYYDIESEDIIKKACPFVLLSSMSSFGFFYDSTLFSILNYSVLGIGSLAVGFGGLGHYYSRILKKDYDKHKLFLDNKELIQRETWKDLRPLHGINKKALKEAMINLEENQNSININTVRLLKQEELEFIINNINNKKKTYSLTR